VNDGATVLFLGGDVMTGRGLDQILPCPSDPELREPSVQDARTYVELAEAAGEAVPRPVDVAWPWGDALRLLDEIAPDIRLVNLETSVTRSDDYEPGKPVHYRMHPANVGCLAAVRPDACALANNHVLDFGDRGLRETLDTLGGAGLRPVGAGRDVVEAWRPARLDVGHRTVLVWSVAMPSSGVPPQWAATEERAGVAFLPDASDASAATIAERIDRVREPGDLVVVSVHWGSNWGYDVPPEHVRFAHQLLDAGVDLLHGHSSHHPRPIEVYRDRLVLYGCGDLIDDYEGIGGYEQYRPDLRLLYFAALAPDTGKLLSLRMVPMRMRRMRLQHASRPDGEWLCGTLDRISREFGSSVRRAPDGSLGIA
jgi:poly-gamma-glutamate synthesis protein (capsule biosynthesis protein)